MATSRVDARAKVTGQATFAADVSPEGRVFGWMVQATVGLGVIRSITVPHLPGVLTVITHENAPRLGEVSAEIARGAGDLVETPPLQSPRVAYRGQVIALVVAETLEQARAAGEAVAVDYDEEPHDVVLTRDHPGMYTPEHVYRNLPSITNTGDVDASHRQSPFRMDATYETPAEHHNPLEPHAATAIWNGAELTVHHSNQGVSWVTPTMAALFGLEEDRVRILAPHVGGGFGGKGRADAPAVLASMAAMRTGRPVTVVATRQQMFAFLGYRTPTIQRVRAAADEVGNLTALEHTAFSQTSRSHVFAQRTAAVSRSMYASDHIRTAHHLVALDVPTPCWMRAPGEAPGSFGLECAIDELAVEAGIDPVALRIRNDTDVEPVTGLKFTSRHLVECLERGSELFGWEQRDPTPGIRRDGRWLVGSGVAASGYHARAVPSTATATRCANGSFTVDISAADIGTGARTVLRQVAADALGTAPGNVILRIADSRYGRATIAGGSMGTASWSWAIHKAATHLRARIDAAPGPEGAEEAEVSVTVDTVEDVARLDASYAGFSFGAQFAEVRVDVDTGEIRVPRMVGVFAAGRVVNPTTARSQIIGAMTMGIGMALHEASPFDARFGGFVNHDLASYHIPSNADVGRLEVDWIHEVDRRINPLGIKGLGEVGIVGTAAAVANAVRHATGVRFRSLPLVPSQVLPALLGRGGIERGHASIHPGAHSSRIMRGHRAAGS